jgi:hypothetical protein
MDDTYESNLMRSDCFPSRKARSTSPSTTAGTLVALVAIAALLAGPVAGVSTMESRVGTREAPSVRAVAAAVAAVARELVGKDRIDLDVPTRHSLASVMMAPPVTLISQVDDQPILPLRTIGERLLDLPPPGC